MSKVFNYGCAALICSVSASGASAETVKRAEKDRPNVFLFIADDWSAPHAGIYGDKTVKTPAVDYVARNGVLFTNAYCAAPTSTSSRASVLTGRYSHALQAAGNLWSCFPKDMKTYAWTLQDNGYEVGYAQKGWGPGVYEEGAWSDNPAGNYRPNFKKFVQKAQSDNKPFCYWYGSKYPHRPYPKGWGEMNGIDPQKVEVPPFLPDNAETRTDIADYYYAVERMDHELQEALTIMKEAGELNNTLIIVTSDNGMPFPRAKASLYDSGTHMPFIVMWADQIKAGSISDEQVSLTDIAPTFLDAANVQSKETMHGMSLLPYLINEEPMNRPFINGGRERHGYEARPNHGGYPVRTLRDGNYLLIHNIRPDRWPGGDPIAPKDGKRGYHDVDGSPTKEYMLNHIDDPDIHEHFLRAFAKRPEYELFDLNKDPNQFNNLASEKKYSKVLKRMKKQMEQWQKDTQDPRAFSDTDIWDTYPYYGKQGGQNNVKNVNAVPKVGKKRAKKNNKTAKTNHDA